jgi:hypothetical protein
VLWIDVDWIPLHNVRWVHVLLETDLLSLFRCIMQMFSFLVRRLSRVLRLWLPNVFRSRIQSSIQIWICSQDRFRIPSNKFFNLSRKRSRNTNQLFGALEREKPKLLHALQCKSTYGYMFVCRTECDSKKVIKIPIIFNDWILFNNEKEESCTKEIKIDEMRSVKQFLIPWTERQLIVFALSNAICSYYSWFVECTLIYKLILQWKEMLIYLLMIYSILKHQ